MRHATCCLSKSAAHRKVVWRLVVSDVDGEGDVEVFAVRESSIVDLLDCPRARSSWRIITRNRVA